MSDTYLYPEAHEAIAASALGQAFWLTQCAYAAKYEAIHGKPAGLTEAQLLQRAGILNIAHDVFNAAAHREWNEAMKQWQTAQAFR